jgi:hypothetical protein
MIKLISLSFMQLKNLKCTVIITERSLQSAFTYVTNILFEKFSSLVSLRYFQRELQLSIVKYNEEYSYGTNFEILLHILTLRHLF